MPAKTFTCASLLLALSLLAATPSGAEIYKRTEADGSVVFTDRVAPGMQHTPWHPTTGGLQRFSRTARPAAVLNHQLLEKRLDATPVPPAPALPVDGGVARIPFQPSGNLMLVNVRLNDGVVAPFYVDSGCTGVSITGDVARKLGLDQLPVRSVARTRTANGTVLLPRYRIDSLALGGMRASDISVTVNHTLSVGLLGASFLDRFVWSVDPVSRILVLEPRSS